MRVAELSMGVACFVAMRNEHVNVSQMVEVCVCDHLVMFILHHLTSFQSFEQGNFISCLGFVGTQSDAQHYANDTEVCKTL